MAKELTREDKIGFLGYATKSENDYPFVQKNIINSDIFGHDDYESFCTKNWTMKPIIECIACHRCNERAKI